MNLHLKGKSWDIQVPQNIEDIPKTIFFFLKIWVMSTFMVFRNRILQGIYLKPIGQDFYFVFIVAFTVLCCFLCDCKTNNQSKPTVY